jgi:hypothetical protein
MGTGPEMDCVALRHAHARLKRDGKWIALRCVLKGSAAFFAAGMTGPHILLYS